LEGGEELVDMGVLVVLIDFERGVVHFEETADAVEVDVVFSLFAGEVEETFSETLLVITFGDVVGVVAEV
jgi:hypothetical protein